MESESRKKESHQERLARLAKVAGQILEAHEKVADFSAADPWSQNAFEPYRAPQHLKKRRDPSRVPDSRMLFDIQRDLLKAIAILKSSDEDEDKIRQSKRQVENGYKLLNRYLRQYVTMKDEDQPQQVPHEGI